MRTVLVFLVTVVLMGCAAPAVSPASSGTPSQAASPGLVPSPTVAAAAPTPSPGPLTTAAPTLPSTPAPSLAPTWPTPQAATFARTIAMKVSVAELNIRAAPTTRGAKTDLTKRDDVILVADWPIRADGYTWYYGWLAFRGTGALPALPSPAVPPGTDPPAGWFAAGTAADPYLIPLAARCPATIKVANLDGMLDSERLACAGGTTIELEGGMGCLDCGGTGSVGEPAWLINDFRDPVLKIGDGAWLSLRFPPGVAGSDVNGKLVRIRGHFDDPRSSTCAIAFDDGQGGSRPLDPEIAVSHCRHQFVVESLVVLGPDPSYQPI